MASRRKKLDDEQAEKSKYLVGLDSLMTPEEAVHIENNPDKELSDKAIQRVMEEKEEEPKGRLGKLSFALVNFLKEYRYQFVIGFLSVVGIWIALNVGVHYLAHLMDWNTVADYLEFDPFPFKLLTFLLSFTGTVLTQIILIAQKKAEALEKKKTELTRKLISKQHLQSQLVQGKLDSIIYKVNGILENQSELLKSIEDSMLSTTMNVSSLIVGVEKKLQDIEDTVTEKPIEKP